MSNITLTATFEDDTGTLVDPTTVTCTATSPAGTVTNPTVTHVSQGVDKATLDANQAGPWRVAFVGTGGTDITVDIVFTQPAYASASELRDELGIALDAMTDIQANKLLADAEDIVDEELGVWPVDTVSGRKILQGNVEAWQWTKLGRATVKLAAKLHASPNLTSPQYRKVSGPDFAWEDPEGRVLGDDVAALLNQSGLRRLTTQVNQGMRGGRPPWYSFSYNDTSWDWEMPPLPTQSGTP